MKSKKGMSTISIVCFLGMVAIVSLSILILEIKKYELIRVGSQQTLARIKAEEEVISILGNFKKQIESDYINDDENIEKFIYNKERHDKLSMNEEIEFSEEILSIEDAIKIKFENAKGIVRYRTESPYIEVKLKNSTVADIEFFYYNYKIDQSGITFIEY